MVTAKQDSLEAVLFWFSRRSEQVPRLLPESGFVCRERGPRGRHGRHSCLPNKPETVETFCPHVSGAVATENAEKTVLLILQHV